jgi:(1->4)-alpha-D-glucan 1-alpha-D-glucosylmutase
VADENIPISTYRVQFNREFRFLDCRDIVPYLHMLGIGSLYSSPRFRARRGSEHGYDVASPLRVNSELGTEEEFADLCEKLRHYGLGLILDIVPNHMAASHENPWWMDVLENGPSSPYAHYFDIDWHPASSKAAFLQENKVLLPVLGDLYGNVLERGELTLGLDETGFWVRYYERQLPLDPASYGPLLEACRECVARELGPDHVAVAEMEAVLRLAAEIPARTATEPEVVGRRLREGHAAKGRIFALYRDHLEARLAMDAALREVSGSADRLDKLLEKQAYRLAFWKIAFEEINYRRFFDINDLVCLRVEEEDVFEARHEIIFQLIGEGKVTGLRVDHIDGLFDPETYLARLESRAKEAANERPIYVVVEKILGRDELLPRSWKTRGTTGYDFLNALNGLSMEPGGLREMEAIYARFTGRTETFGEVSYARNKLVMWRLFAAEVHTLGHELGKLAARDRQARDVPMSELIGALVEVTACLPIYRTYIRSAKVSQQDRARLERTLEAARRRTPESEIGDPAFEFLRRVLLLEPPAYAAELGAEYLRFVMRWQQFTGPVMAKGLEDTAGYVHNSLISMNEVGSDPVREEPPLDVEGFHGFLKERLRLWPHTMNATSTHDTKRSEDARARINALTEFSGEWEKRLLKWRRLNQGCKTEVKGMAVPAPGEEVLLYETLLGAWPLEEGEEAGFLERVQEFLRKAVREAKVHSGWLQPDEAHEEAVLRFASEIFHGGENPFREDFLRFQSKIAWHGALNSLAQVLIKITAPGVPDFYQGCELWDLSMVDPDNRRKVDFSRRIGMLEELRRGLGANRRRQLREMLRHWRDGRVKLYLTDRALDFRRLHAGVYQEGEYVPVEATGPKRANLCAFARHAEGQWCATVTPRWTTQLAPVGRAPLGSAAWKETRLRLPEGAPEEWENALTGERVKAAEEAGGAKSLAVGEVLERFPVALLGAKE